MEPLAGHGGFGGKHDLKENKSKRIVIFDTLIEGYKSEIDSSQASKHETLNGIYNEPEKKVEKSEKVNFFSMIIILEAL